MISKTIVTAVNRWLDDAVSGMYKDQPMAQDWARVAKVGEEYGEAIAELILLTGQNPRKGIDPFAYNRMLNELADVALTAVFAIQHFTEDADNTASIIAAREEHVMMRVPVRNGQSDSANK